MAKHFIDLCDFISRAYSLPINFRSHRVWVSSIDGFIGWVLGWAEGKSD